MRWQDVRNLGIGLFKKRTRSRTLWVGGSSTVFGLIGYLLLLTGMSETHSGDSYCDYNEKLDLDKCEAFINITTSYWRICFKDDFKFITTEPNIPTELYVPTYGKRWRLFNSSKDCIERKKINKFKIIGYKETSQTVKWSFKLDTYKTNPIEIDPVWFGINITKLCRYEKVQNKKTARVYNDTTIEYTCPFTRFSVNKSIKKAYCYNDTLDVNGTYNLIKSMFYDYGYISNKTVYKRQHTYLYNYVKLINKTVCNKVGYQINKYQINFTKCGINCRRDGTIIQCDDCSDGNCDGYLTSGESGLKPIDLRKPKWKKNIKNWKTDTPQISERMKKCVSKV